MSFTIIYTPKSSERPDADRWIPGSQTQVCGEDVVSFHTLPHRIRMTNIWMFARCSLKQKRPNTFQSVVIWNNGHSRAWCTGLRMSPPFLYFYVLIFIYQLKYWVALTLRLVFFLHAVVSGDSGEVSMRRNSWSSARFYIHISQS